MREIILKKRYPHSREEDITDAFMRGYEIGKEQEHRWWSAFCANCKTENSSEIPTSSEPQTCPFSDCDNFKNPDYARCVECKRKQIEPKTEVTIDCRQTERE